MNAATDSLRPLISRLARRLATDDGNAILRELQFLGRDLAAGAKAPPPRPSAGAPGTQLAVWEAKDGPQGREFLRDRKHFHHWRAAADVERIPPKTARKRVAFLGESAARGFYYDPAYTVAGALQEGLDAAGGGFEVVDLAVTAIRPMQLMGVLRQLPLLQPDLIVLFAGNNWHEEFEREPSGAGEAGALAQSFARGIENYRAEFERRVIGGVAERVLGTLAGVAGALKIPVVIVVPEFNLGDWIDDVPLPMLPGAQAEGWRRLCAEAEAACETGRWPEAARLAERVRQIDRGLTPASGRLLGKIAVGLGRTAEARTHFESARDSLGGIPYGACPRCLSSTQAQLRAAEKRFGMTVVDLPRLLSAEESIPARSLFLDYCHMSALGIRRSMAAVANAVAGALPGKGLKTIGAADLREPDSAVSAAAHIFAAAHNAILEQPYAVVSHHVREGLRLDPAAIGLLHALLGARAEDFPDWLDGKLAQACALPNSRRFMIRPVLASEGRHFPYELLPWAGEGTGREIAARRRGRTLDLLDSQHRSSNLHLRRTAHLAEKRLRSEFRFCSPAAARLKIAVCWRTPGAAEPAQVVRVLFGGNEIWRGHVGVQWRNQAIEFDGAAAGSLGALSVEWPVLSEQSAAWNAALKSAQDCVDRGEAPDIFPTCGEIQSLNLQWQ